MDFFKSYDRFNESTQGMFKGTGEGALGHHGFSVANSTTGNFFYQVFRKLTYFKRRGSLQTLANRLDEVLEREYLKFMRDGKPSAPATAGLASPATKGEEDDTREGDEYSDTQDNPNAEVGEGEDTKGAKKPTLGLKAGPISAGALGMGSPGGTEQAVGAVEKCVGDDCDDLATTNDEEYDDYELVDPDSEDFDDYEHNRQEYKDDMGIHQGGRQLSLPAAPVTKLLPRMRVALSASPVRLLPQSVASKNDYENPTLDSLENALKNAKDATELVKIHNQLVLLERKVGDEYQGVSAHIKKQGGYAEALRMVNLTNDLQRIEKLFSRIAHAFKQQGYNFRPKRLNTPARGQNEAVALTEGITLVDGAVREDNWTKENTAALTARLNMEELEGFHIRSKLFINDNNRKRDQFRLENLWDEVLNTVYKKWYHIYDIPTIKSKYTPKAGELTTALKDPTKKTAYRTNAAFDSVFERETATYLSPSFVGITAVKAVYFIFTLNANKMLLLKKCAFHKNMLFFKIVGEITSFEGREHEFYICDDYKRRKDITKDGSTLALRNTDNKYPLVLFFRDKVYSTDIKDDATTVNSMTLDQFTITAIKKDSIFKNILTNSQQKNTSNFDGTLDTNISQDVIAKFEKLIRR